MFISNQDTTTSNQQKIKTTTSNNSTQDISAIEKDLLSTISITNTSLIKESQQTYNISVLQLPESELELFRKGIVLPFSGVPEKVAAAREGFDLIVGSSDFDRKLILDIFSILDTPDSQLYPGMSDMDKLESHEIGRKYALLARAVNKENGIYDDKEKLRQETLNFFTLNNDDAAVKSFVNSLIDKIYSGDPTAYEARQELKNLFWGNNLESQVVKNVKNGYRLERFNHLVDGLYKLGGLPHPSTEAWEEREGAFETITGLAEIPLSKSQKTQIRELLKETTGWFFSEEFTEGIIAQDKQKYRDSRLYAYLMHFRDIVPEFYNYELYRITLALSKLQEKALLVKLQKKPQPLRKAIMSLVEKYEPLSDIDKKVLGDALSKIPGKYGGAYYQIARSTSHRHFLKSIDKWRYWDSRDTNVSYDRLIAGWDWATLDNYMAALLNRKG